MLFGKTYWEKEAKKISWQPKFAWLPTFLTNTKIVWLETYYRHGRRTQGLRSNPLYWEKIDKKEYKAYAKERKN